MSATDNRPDPATVTDSQVEAAVDVAADLPTGTVEDQPHTDVQQVIRAFDDGALDVPQCLWEAAVILHEQGSVPASSMQDWIDLGKRLGPTVLADVEKVVALVKLLAPLV